MKNQLQEATQTPVDDFHVVPSGEELYLGRPYQNLLTRVPYTALSDAISIEKRYLTSASGLRRRPTYAGQFPWQLFGIDRINEREVHLGFRALKEFQFLWRPHNEPQHLGIRGGARGTGIPSGL